MVKYCVGGGGGMASHLCVAEREGLCMLDKLGMGVMVLFWITWAFNEMILLNKK